MIIGARRVLNLQTVENKVETDYSLEILGECRASRSEKTPFEMTPLSGPDR